MKRSSAIKKIQNFLSSSTDFITGELYIDANDIMRLMEEIGMQPPPTKLLVTNQLDPNLNGVRTANIWEPEDETQ